MGHFIFWLQRCNEYKECLLRVQTTQQARSLIWTTSTLAVSMWETSHILSWCCTRIHQHRDATYAWNPLNAWSISPITLLIFTLNIGFRGDTSLRTSFWFFYRINFLLHLLTFSFTSEPRRTNKAGWWEQRTLPRNWSVWVFVSLHSTKPSETLLVVSGAKGISSL